MGESWGEWGKGWGNESEAPAPEPVAAPEPAPAPPPTRPIRLQHLAPLVETRPVTEFEEYADMREKCATDHFLYTRQHEAVFRKYGVKTGEFGVEVGSRFNINPIMPVYSEKIGDGVFITKPLMEELKKPFEDDVNAILFHVLYTQGTIEWHIIGGFITRDDIILVHHYDYPCVEKKENDEVWLKNLNELRGKFRENITIYPTYADDTGYYNVQKADHQIENRGLCHRWFLVIPLAIAKAMNNNRENWRTIGTPRTWGVVVEPIYRLGTLKPFELMSKTEIKYAGKKSRRRRQRKLKRKTRKAL